MDIQQGQATRALLTTHITLIAHYSATIHLTHHHMIGGKYDYA